MEWIWFLYKAIIGSGQLIQHFVNFDFNWPKSRTQGVKPKGTARHVFSFYFLFHWWREESSLYHRLQFFFFFLKKQYRWKGTYLSLGLWRRRSFAINKEGKRMVFASLLFSFRFHDCFFSFSTTPSASLHWLELVLKSQEFNLKLTYLHFCPPSRLERLYCFFIFCWSN